MSENEKKPTSGEPISEEQLDAVSGGGGTGDVSNPIHDSQCWFKAEGEAREDGRILCKTQCKGIFDPYGKPITSIGIMYDLQWFICPCWGSDNCIDKWHKPCGKQARTNW